MLRVRRGIETALRRRWLGLFVVLLLAIVVVFVLVHDAEHALDGAAAVCLALAVVFSTLVLAAVATRLGRILVGLRGRAPPALFGVAVATTPTKPVPLRL
jgi:hypothetical protein